LIGVLIIIGTMPQIDLVMLKLIVQFYIKVILMFLLLLN
jgi:hypothetical protein